MAMRILDVSYVKLLPAVCHRLTANQHVCPCPSVVCCTNNK